MVLHADAAAIPILILPTPGCLLIEDRIPGLDGTA
jgi:hypothetical protein